MLCNKDNELGALIGATICGQTFRACDDDSAYAMFRLGNAAYGVIIEKGRKRPYLRIHPAIQIPAEARGGFERFQFECDDERIVDMRHDSLDGELRIVEDLADLDPATIERTLSTMLAWLDEAAVPEIMTYIAKTYADERE